MSDLQVSIQIDTSFSGLVDEDRARHVVAKALAAAGIDAAVDIGLVITGDQMVRDLNRDYRGIDATTDVLSFALSEKRAGEDGDFVVPPDDTLHLGEIVISYPQAERQAGEQQHPVEREMALLIAHGTLHLLGYDHVEPQDEERMRAAEARVLAEIESP